MSDSIIIFDKVSVYSRVTSSEVLHPFDLEIKPGKILSVTGSSGSGKTTFLKLVTGMLRADSGWKAGGRMKKMPGLRIGWIAQNPALQLFKNFVYEEFFPMPRGDSEKFLSKFGLGQLAGRRCCELSQGEKALVVFASVMSRNVKLLVMDEVMVNLSAARRLRLKKWLKDFVSAGGSVITVEHTADMLDISDGIMHIDCGRLEPLSRDAARWILSVDFSGLPAPGNLSAGDSGCLEVSGLSDTGISCTSQAAFGMRVKKGEFLGIKGDNGCGKTTLLHVLAGLVKPRKGRVSLDGKKLSGLRIRLGRVSFVGHEPLNQLFGTTVAGEFDFTFLGRAPAAVGKLLEYFRLDKLSGRRIHTLSYGEQQRLVLAANLAGGADVLLLDEPTYGMDGVNMRRFIEILLAEKQKGRTIVMASHDETVLNRIADRVISI